MTDDTTGTETARWVGPCIDRFGAERPNHVRSSDDPYRCMICAAFNEGAALARIAELEAAPAAPTEARGPGEAWKPSDGDTKCQTCHQPNARWFTEAAAPETEGPVAPCSRKDAHDPHEHWDVPASEPGEYRDAHICRGIEPFPTAEPLTAQPAAEGAREDDGLDREELEHTIFGAMEALGIEDAAMSDARMIADAVDGLLSDWLAEDRRRARAEGGADALEEAAAEMPSHVTASSDERPINCVADARAWLRDRAAGMRETGGKG